MGSYFLPIELRKNAPNYTTNGMLKAHLGDAVVITRYQIYIGTPSSAPSSQITCGQGSAYQRVVVQKLLPIAALRALSESQRWLPSQPSVTNSTDSSLQI